MSSHPLLKHVFSTFSCAVSPVPSFFPESCDICQASKMGWTTADGQVINVIKFLPE